MPPPRAAPKFISTNNAVTATAHEQCERADDVRADVNPSRVAAGLGALIDAVDWVVQGGVRGRMSAPSVWSAATC